MRDGTLGFVVHELETQFVGVAGFLASFEGCISGRLRGINLPVIVDIVPVDSRRGELSSDIIEQVFEQERLL